MISLVSPRVITHNVGSFMQHKDHDVNVGCHPMLIRRQGSTCRKLVVFNTVFTLPGFPAVTNLTEWFHQLTKSMGLDTMVLSYSHDFDFE